MWGGVLVLWLVGGYSASEGVCGGVCRTGEEVMTGVGERGTCKGKVTVLKGCWGEGDG